MIIGFFRNFFNMFSRFLITDGRRTESETPVIHYENIDDDSIKIDAYLN